MTDSGWFFGNEHPALERFQAKVLPFQETGCWIWSGFHNHDGYGRFNFDGRIRFAHCVSYELFVGPIPKGKELDHVCRVRNCVNPSHLEPVTHAENVKRGLSPIQLKERAAAKTHCKRGHPLSGENLRYNNGKRSCKACANARKRKPWRVGACVECNEIFQTKRDDKRFCSQRCWQRHHTKKESSDVQ